MPRVIRKRCARSLSQWHPSQIRPAKSYKIGPRDTLEVTVFQAPELTKTVQVSEAGTINFPLIGELDAAGKKRPRD